MALALLWPPPVPRSALLCMVASITLASGCATSSGDGRPQLADAAFELGALVVGAGVYALVTRPPGAPAGAADRAEQPLVGQVRWKGSSEGVPAVTVTLRRADGVVVPSTTTDRAGWFRFPFPPKPAWYTVAVDAAAAEGETTLWLQDRRPAALDVLVRPRSLTRALDDERPVR
jgi:hypothetical protein